MRTCISEICNDPAQFDNAYCWKHQRERALAAESQCDELAAQLATQKELTAWWHSESDKNATERDALIDTCEDYKRMVNALNPLCKRLKNENVEYGGRLSEMTEEIMKLRNEIAYLRSTDHAAEIAFERTAPIDWRPSEYEAETPLGHALEESGEVDG